jgi:lipopolysaccharide transport system ATP-binding protein
MPTAIKIEDVSKLYRLGTVGTGTISHDLNRWWHQIRSKEDPYAKVGQVNDRTKKSSDVSRQSSETADCQLPTANSPSSPSANCQLPTLTQPALPALRSPPDYVWALKRINLEVHQVVILGTLGRRGAGRKKVESGEQDACQQKN